MNRYPTYQWTRRNLQRSFPDQSRELWSHQRNNITTASSSAKTKSKRTDELTALKRLRRSAGRKFRRSRTISNGIRYRLLKGQFQKALNKAKEDHWKAFVEALDFRGAMRKTWRELNHMRGGRKKTMVVKLRKDGRIIEEAQEVAEVLLERFASSLTKFQ